MVLMVKSATVIARLRCHNLARTGHVIIQEKGIYKLLLGAVSLLAVSDCLNFEMFVNGLCLCVEHRESHHQI